MADWFPDFAGTENAYLVDAIGSVEFVDDLTVKFAMARPEPNLLYNLASPFMGVPEQAAFDSMGDDFNVKSAIGTGPFKLERFTIGPATVLVRNEDCKWASDLSENPAPPHMSSASHFARFPTSPRLFLN